MSATNTDFYTQLENNLEFIQCVGKTKEEQSEKAMELVSLLKDLETVMDEVKDGGKTATGTKGSAPGFLAKLPTLSGGTNSLSSGPSGSTSGSGSSFPLPPNAPSPQQIAAALAAIQAILANLQEQKESNPQNQEALTMIEAQLASAEASMQSYLNVIEKLQNEWNEFQQFLQQNNGQFNSWMNHRDWPWYYFGFKSEPDPETSKVTSAIEKWVQANLGITINLDSSASSLSQILASATSQIEASFNVTIAAASSQLSSMMNGSGNSLLSTMLNMILSGQSFNGTGTLEQLEQILAEAMKLIAMEGQTFSGKGGPSDNLIVTMMAVMTEMVSSVQETIMQSQGEITTDNSNVSQAMTVQAQVNLQHTENELAKQAREEAEESFFDKFIKIITAIVTVIVIAICCATGNFAMAALMAAMYVMQVSGGFNELSKGFALAFEKMGVSANTANIIGSCLTIALTIAATAATGNFSSILDEAGALSTRGLFSAIGSASLALSNGIQAGMSTNLIDDCVIASLSSGASQEKIAAKEGKIELILGILAAVLALGGAVGQGFGSVASEVGTDATEEANSIASKLQSFLKANLTKLIFSELAGQAMNGGINIALGNTKLEQADTEEVLGKLQSLQSILNMIMNNTNTLTTNSQQFFGNILKGDGQVSAQVDQKMFAYEAEYAQLLAQGA